MLSDISKSLKQKLLLRLKVKMASENAICPLCKKVKLLVDE